MLYGLQRLLWLCWLGRRGESAGQRRGGEPGVGSPRRPEEQDTQGSPPRGAETLSLSASTWPPSPLAAQSATQTPIQEDPRPDDFLKTVSSGHLRLEEAAGDHQERPLAKTVVTRGAGRPPAPPVSPSLTSLCTDRLASDTRITSIHCFYLPS